MGRNYTDLLADLVDKKLNPALSKYRNKGYDGVITNNISKFTPVFYDYAYIRFTGLRITFDLTMKIVNLINSNDLYKKYIANENELATDYASLMITSGKSYLEGKAETISDAKTISEDALYEIVSVLVDFIEEFIDILPEKRRK